MTSPQQALVAMAVAEAGYDPAGVLPIDSHSSVTYTGAVFIGAEHNIPVEVVWRARELAATKLDGDPVCCACFSPEQDLRSYMWAFKVAGRLDGRACEAVLPLTPDCGRERT
ncbi:MAG: hypothetical protein JWM89_1814 [Acidimicrobiales bacterium]|nr:hypothetical protein [Acidimicrobiales bacterium]